MSAPVTTPNRLIYADVLRALATVAVIVLHIASTYIYGFSGMARDEWWAANFYDSATRWCVPIFLMLSGSLLLRPNSQSPGIFLWKRATRVLVPFLIWNAVYLWFEYGTFILNNGYVPWLQVVTKVLQGQVRYHFWFVYLIISLYLIIPVLRTFVQHAAKADLRYYLWLWVILSFLSILLRVLKLFHLLSEDVWVFSVLELTGYAGYFILGWAMSVHAISFSRNTLLGLLIAGFLLTLQGTFVMTNYKNSLIEMFYENLQPTVMMMSIAVFGLVQRAFTHPDRNVSPAVARFLADFTKLSFGIYLMHVLVMEQLNEGIVLGKSINGITILDTVVHPWVGIPVATAITLLVCYAVMKLLSYVPKVRDWVM
jgi:surface polysaccharide O-acyltransferase-like enzyme